MRTIGIRAIGCLLASYASLMAEPANGDWPVLAENLEDAIPDASGAFVGTIEFSDVERRSPNVIAGSARLVSAETIWGQPISGPIELGHQRLLLHGGSGRGLDSWVGIAHLMARNIQSVPILAVFRERDRQTGLLYLQFSEDKLCARERADFQEILRLRNEVRGENLRNELLGIAVAPDSSEVLWSYALRQLFSLGDHLEGRISNTFGPDLQKTGDAKRIHYALRLLVTNGFSSSVVQTPANEQSKPHRNWLRGGPCDGRALRWRLLDAFEGAPNGAVAFATALTLLGDDPASHVRWADAEMSQIQKRIIGALNNPTRAGHGLSAAQKRLIQKELERLTADTTTER